MEFELTINPIKFRSTNAAWNELRLNDPWSVGYVSTLIELNQFERKEDWERFYFNSGELREKALLKLDESEQQLLNDNALLLMNPHRLRSLSWILKSLNTQHGRTKERLFEKGEILFGKVRNNGKNLTIDECYECVRFRVICETWNGIILRERNTINTLSKHFPITEFRKVVGEIDHEYAVDYELYKHGKLIGVTQVKPKSYIGKAVYIQKARAANQRKNAAYLSKYGVSVYDVISNSKGVVHNLEIFKMLSRL
jgi:hypothetical protein